MPTDTFLAHLVRRDWLTDGPLSELIISYIEALQSRRYARNTLSGYLRCLAHFNYWMRGEGKWTLMLLDLGARIKMVSPDAYQQEAMGAFCPCPMGIA